MGYKLRSDLADFDSSDEEAGDRSRSRKKSVTFKQSDTPLNAGDSCRVKSHSLNRWLPAKVTKIDSHQKTVSVRYETPNGPMAKDLPFSSPDLHIQSESEGTPVRDYYFLPIFDKYTRAHRSMHVHSTPVLGVCQ